MRFTRTGFHKGCTEGICWYSNKNEGDKTDIRIFLVDAPGLTKGQIYHSPGSHAMKGNQKQLDLLHKGFNSSIPTKKFLGNDGRTDVINGTNENHVNDISLLSTDVSISNSTTTSAVSSVTASKEGEGNNSNDKSNAIIDRNNVEVALAEQV